MRQEQLIDISIEPTFLLYDTQQLHALQGADDGFVRVSAGGIGVETDGAFEQEGVLRDSDNTGPDFLTRDAGEFDPVDGDMAGAELDHSKDGKDEGALAAKGGR